MRITVSEIPPEGRDIDETLSIEVDEGVFSEASVHLHLERVDEDVFVHGDISARTKLACGRCLDEFVSTVSVPVEMSFLPSGDESGGEEQELSAEDVNTEYYSDDRIDLDEAIREQILLNLPLKPLCSEECRGICPSCGINLNQESCGCDTKKIDPRLEVLKKLLDKGKE